MNRNKRKYDSIKIACQIDRQRELEKYGRIVSMRPSIAHKSKKGYNRQQNKNIAKNLNEEQ